MRVRVRGVRVEHWQSVYSACFLRRNTLYHYTPLVYVQAVHEPRHQISLLIIEDCTVPFFTIDFEFIHTTILCTFSFYHLVVSCLLFLLFVGVLGQTLMTPLQCHLHNL